MVVAGIFTFFYRPQLLTRLLNHRTHDNVYFYINTDQKIIALTIDDGPHHTITPQILKLLAQYNAKATFFVIGERVAGNESLVKKIVTDGHEIGNHLMRDARSIQLTPDEFEQELQKTHELLTGFDMVRWFRPGSGMYNQRMLGQIQKYNYSLALGSVYPYDAHLPYPPFSTRYILDNVKPGAILILHDGVQERGERTVQVLEEVLPALTEQGYQIVTLSQLIQTEN